MKKKFVLCGKISLFALMAWVFLMGASRPLRASDMGVLVDKLVEKGTLSQEEGDKILRESKKDEKKSEIPAWLRRTKLKGDLRLRYEGRSRDNTAARNRGRYRFRLAAQSNLGNGFDVYVRIASGGSDPRSTNQTFTNTFSTPDLRLDRAYASYKASSGGVKIKIQGGKMANPLKRVSDLLWDSDINPGGASLEISSGGLSLGGGFFVLDERAAQSNPLMWYTQPSFKLDLGEEGSYAKGYFSYYGFSLAKGRTLNFTSGTNSMDAAGNLSFDQDAWNVGGELGIVHPFDFLNLPIPFFAAFGEFVQNIDPSNNNNAYVAGAKIGHKKVKGWGTWQIKYMNKWMEKDSWLDTFPDSDQHSGQTDVKGNEVIGNLGITDHVSMEVDYYHSQRILVSNQVEDLIQADLNFKF